MMLYNKSISETEENGKRITLLSLSIPLLLENLLLQFYSTANTLLIKGHSESAVSAVSISESILNIAIVLFTMAIKGSVILTNLSLGRKDRKNAAQIAGTALICVALVSILIGAGIFLLSPGLVSLMNLKGSVADEAAGYLRIRAIFLLFTALMSFFNNLLISNGHTKSTILVGIMSNALNILICYILLYTGIKLPFEGIYALAISSVLSQIFGTLASLLFFRRAKCPYRFCFQKHIFSRIMTLGIPGGMCTLSYTLSQAVTTGFTAMLGTTIVNAKVYISNIVMYTHRISLAVGNATGILMGRHRGANKFSSICGLFRQNIGIALASNITLSLAVFLFRKPLLSLFTYDAKIFVIATPIMLIDILIEGSRGVNHITENALNANGDVRATLIISVFSAWFFGVLATYLLGIVFGVGLIGIWIAFAADEFFKAVFYYLRWKSGKWQKTTL